ncbi:uncharacterized protein LOC133877568 isoform X1 [Alnus glutinosa]|uniref:uncharacterized protein LOC133877568 isoform X1 n=1 Tax=Alnus glutinosa TaxID=3517 RepID=UPI002D794DC8|nr:uncharacterized protein LOC133877568 isoform X1 [Alnus glutinosa]XP_062171911.1 uncharacterized protein LOC133877568 isoform X1 [Alnus glutinosa]XP_062171912.1 uncharacterized protein LOC133877568 isoform X1 [Alnus glutinosa]
MEGDNPTTLMCTVLAIDHTSFCYRVCLVCERTLPDNSTSLCKFCNFNAFNSVSTGSKRLFRVLISIASDTKVFTVICFDRAAKVLFGCSADEFFDFAKLHPFAGVMSFCPCLDKGACFATTLNKRENRSCFIDEGDEDGHSEGRSGAGHHQRGQRVGHTRCWRGWLEVASGGFGVGDASGGARVWHR